LSSQRRDFKGASNMRGKLVLAGLILSFSGVAASAQTAASVPIGKDLYCTGTITSEAVPTDSYVITGEGSNYKITFTDGDYVYLNKGASAGVKVGDEFSVIRKVVDPTEEDWSKWQSEIIRKLGTWWEDEGRVRRRDPAVQGTPGASAETRRWIRPVRAVQRESDGDGDDRKSVSSGTGNE
jgi:hypothetical protein